MNQPLNEPAKDQGNLKIKKENELGHSSSKEISSDKSEPNSVHDSLVYRTMVDLPQQLSMNENHRLQRTPVDRVHKTQIHRESNNVTHAHSHNFYVSMNTGWGIYFGHRIRKPSRRNEFMKLILVNSMVLHNSFLHVCVTILHSLHLSCDLYQVR